ncbi:fibronectin type III domain-containing protein [Streptomyces andamanensis]|uniref:Fibronectin type III domain-containing protein n=1 Tax=Streptomyces andamanensis TaxID=1565035 RepID=A0ABV8TCK2_9ACTN
MAAPTGGINILVDRDTMNAVAQRVVCWDKDGSVPAQAVQYRTDGNLPYFHVPGGVCAHRGALKLSPGGATVACPGTGNPTVIQPTVDEILGLNPNSCQEVPAPTGLAVQGSPAADSITVGWQAPAGGADSYLLSYRKDGSTGAWTHVEVPGSLLQATVNGLTASTAYNFHVAARRGPYQSAPTADVKISTAASS